MKDPDGENVGLFKLVGRGVRTSTELGLLARSLFIVRLSTNPRGLSSMMSVTGSKDGEAWMTFALIMNDPPRPAASSAI